MSLSQTRTRTTKALRGLELPACFQLATISAALNATERQTVSAKASRRRLNEKALKIAAVAS